ncbi:MAG: MFS transporter, partial [Candidatus Altiarchaeales archaeon]|nr:MFS transporter [Candidatus Altiarchaeales archaeon]
MGNLKNLFYSSFFSGIVAGALGVILPVYLSEVFKTSLTTMGFVFSAYALLFALLQIPSSFLGDRFRKKTILLVSAV